MRWYEGGIAEAVAASKKNNAIFVVYIHGTDANSTQISSIINREEVSDKLGDNSFVAIQIEAGTLPHEQFAQIYKLASVPSLFFIGKNGVPLEIVTEIKSAEEFVAKIEALIKNNQTGAAKSARESDGFIKAEQTSSTAAQSNTNAVCDNGVCTLKTEQASTSQDKALTAEEKVERAKSLIDKTREVKEKEDHEKEKSKELERRKMGQDVQKLKRWQEDQELKQLKEERDREKKEQQAARERVLAQIAQDKADRLTRFSNISPQQQQTSPQPVRRSPTSSGDKARLQFKLADGSSHTHDFNSSDTLETVRDYITGNLSLTYNNFLLSTTFPRREFNNNDYSQTLADLGLVPNAVVLILPISHGAVSTNTGGGLTAILWSLLAPILNIFNYIKNYFKGQKQQAQTSGQGPTSTNKRPAENIPETSRSVSKRRPGDSTVVRREGNIHRLSDKTDSDEDNNTWNGNSTQQM